MGEETKINISHIKDSLKKIINNRYTLLFSVSFLIVVLVLILKMLNLGSGIDFFSKLFSAFSTETLLLLSGALIISAILAHYKKFKWMFLPIIIWLILTAAMVRTSNIELLKDVTTGDYTLGPDLDPYLYLRHATEISEGTLQKNDYFRQAPVGVENYAYKNLMPWTIFYVYKFLSLFSDTSIIYAAILTPVILFIISALGFILFTKTVASFKLSKETSWLVGVISGFFYIYIPSMLHRTVAGIPEIESLGLVWFWFAFLFFALAWKQEIKEKQIIFGVLAGIFTGLMSWSWGGYRYIYMILSLTILVLFLFGKNKPKIFIIFSSWIVPALILELLKVENLFSMLASFSDTGFALFVWFILITDLVINKSKIKDIRYIKKINLPESIKSLIIGSLLILILLLIVNPSFTVNAFSTIIEGLLYPFGRGRVGLTVAENKAPYLTEVLSNFGYLFFLFLLGNIIIFYEATKHFSKNKKAVLNFIFIIFIFGLSFTRFSPTSIFNGENFISKFTYLGSILLFTLVLVSLYIKAHLNNDERTTNDFHEIDFSYLIVLAFAFWAMISMRGAIRLFVIISPMLIMSATYVPVRFFGYLKKKRDELSKLFLLIILIISVIAMILIFVNYSFETTITAKNIAPSSYNQQWQQAMSWVREDTPENSIFVHWWDYGYWVQTLGERPTVTDGGHANEWWDHTTARYLLTTPNPETALSLMKTHNVSYLLIDSTDLGKYTAYSSIGSGSEGEDRLSSLPIMVLDSKQTQETNDSKIRIYQGVASVDEDVVYNTEQGQIFLPEQKAVVIGAILRTRTSKNEVSFVQPEAVFVYNQQQIRIPIRYIYYNDEIIDFKGGLESTIFILPRVTINNNQVEVDNFGTLIYLSPKVSKGLFAQLYLMNDPFNNYPTLKLAHSEQEININLLKVQGANIGEFVYLNGFRGPIKIWKVDYPENILAREEFLRMSGEYAELDDLEFVR